jgi:type I restriction enzyme S subunit
MIDVDPRHLETVKTILCRSVPGREVWVFGSRPARTAKAHSDLDLAIIGDEPLSLGQLAVLENDFDESELPFKVDVVDWAAASEPFRQVIRKTAVVLITLDKEG